MAEKDKGKPVEPVEPDPNDPTPQPDPGPEPKPTEPPAPTIPKEYEGKSMEDVIKMVADAQKELGGKAKEIGDLKNNLAYSDQLRELAMQRAREPQPVQPEEVKPDWNFEKPIESVEQIVDKRLAAREKKTQEYNVQRVREEAQSNYAEGRRLSLKRNPALFEGIERDVENAVYEGWTKGQVKLHDLRNPDAWDIVAKMHHLRDNRIDRLQPTAIQPVETIEGQLPTPAPPGTTEKPFTGLDYTDRETQKMMDQFGLTKEEAEEIIKEEQEAIAKGER
ncbi:hypothetical protein LCGC14_1668200 [marine sediment metagenome]|uniref:Uncharacterized protein n=1 Tax=marine sediment metagenome TaxID=412755 RepID=A0A0F9KS44_9ZZZZ